MNGLDKTDPSYGLCYTLRYPNHFTNSVESIGSVSPTTFVSIQKKKLYRNQRKFRLCQVVKLVNNWYSKSTY